jgi:hypothetical protein
MTQTMTQTNKPGLWHRMKARARNVKQRVLDWTDKKIFDFIMAHINLEETILLGASKATTERFHLTSFALIVTYYVWRIEAKFKAWSAKKPKVENV